MNRAQRLLSALLAVLLLTAPGCGGPHRYKPDAARNQREAMEARIAQVLAEEVSAVAPSPSRVAVVYAAPDTNFADEHARILSALRVALRKRGGEPLEWALAAPPGATTAGPGYEPPPAELTGAWLAQRLHEAPDVGGIISLLDAPTGTPAQLPADLPPLVCLAPLDGLRVGPLMRAGRITAAIVPRRTPAPARAQDWFDLRFEQVRPDTVAAWEQARGGAQP
jgi:hypothetical protein